jgi:type IV pilus assembly protein PilY1
MKSLPIARGARRQLAKRLIAAATLATFIATPPYAVAALTDISNAPISSAASTTVPPNVLFILDASGSMNSEFMPDEMGSYDGKASYASHRCNTIYYNPATTYLVPKRADGTDFPVPSFTGADNDGFLSSGNTGSPSNLNAGSTTNLSTSYKGTTNGGSERAFYYQWNGASPPTVAECQGSAPSASRNVPHTTGNWQKVQIPTAQETNFAIWFTYYRTRMLLMKSAAGRAFNGLNDTFRVGFITICPNGGSCGNDNDVTPVLPAFYLKIDAFTPTHKSNWYNKFYSQVPSSFTPLRQALARAGRHYAGLKDGINSGMNEDPIQYSCQQNFSILTTDGYWNYGKGKTLTNGTSGSGDIGNHDNNSGLSPRPMFDGGIATTTETRYQTGGSLSGCPPPQRAILRQRTTPQFSTTTYSNVSSTVCVPAGTCVATSDTDTSCPWSSPTVTYAGSTGNTLADVAEYYYRNDLRSNGSIGALGTDVGTINNVPASGTGPEDDKATWQHMTTFTLGLGLDGQLKYDANYKAQTTGDFADIRSGAKGWPNPNPSNPNTGSTTEQQARIDDLWHAGVNGRGQYFSAKDPTSLALSLTTALSAIQARLASAAAAATSSLEPTDGDNLVVLPTYTTNEWSGEVEAHEIDLATGAVKPAVTWSAQAKLDARTKAACDDRNILLFRSGAPDNLVDFTWNTTKCSTGSPSTALNTTEQEFFTTAGPKDELADLSQWSLMTEDGAGPLADQQTAAQGANLVNFIRGHRGKEGFTPNDINKLYRARKHVLGDVVNSQPVYVRKAFFSYADTSGPGGYAAFKLSMDGRTPMVYVAANDGTLHAFYGTTDTQGGEEAWAFMPSAVLPRLYKLADNNYANLHEYYVDGKPVTGDVFDPNTNSWRTILVGGLNKGGRAYYALDITNPATPKALWEFKHSATCFSSVVNEFSDCHLGYTFGNPVITKLADGRWVVLVTSGYNNLNTPAQTGDGQGYLYVLEASTGKILYKIGTGVGDPTTPSGLTKLSAWVDNPDQNNMASRVYGVDLLGNVWRFDINDAKDALGNPILPPVGREASLLATLKDAAGNPQPITVRPELAEVGSPPVPFVYVSTGQYLGTSDVSTTQTQSIYAIRDSFTTYSNLRSSLKQLTLTTVGNDRFVSCDTASPAANCGSTTGWFVDLTESGERVNVDMKLQLGVLVVASNVPTNTACEPGGFSFLNFFDFTTGLSPAGLTQRVGYRLSSALTVGISIMRLPDGKVVVLGQKSTAGLPDIGEVPIPSGSPTGKRITWREIMQ